jgi:hypothetical protein
MTNDTPARSRTGELTGHQRIFAKAFALMQSVAVVNFALWALIVFLEMVGIPVDSSAYVVFGACLLIFVAALGVRFYCLACFVGGAEIRGKRELFFVPRNVPNGLAQRLYTAASMAAWDCFMGILAGYTLRIVPIRNDGSVQFSLVDASGTVVAVVFCLVLFAVIALKTILLLLQACGWTALYDPRERTASAEVQQRSPHAMKALVVLRGISRQAALALCATVAFLPAAVTLSRRNALIYAVPVWFLLGIIASFVAVMLLRLAVIAWCFSRYSIRHVLGFNLAVGACVSLAISGPPGINTAAGTCAAIITFVALCYIAMQDPEGDVYTPAFIRERIREQRREKYQAKLKQNLQHVNEDAAIRQRQAVNN